MLEAINRIFVLRLMSSFHQDSYSCLSYGLWSVVNLYSSIHSFKHLLGTYVTNTMLNVEDIIINKKSHCPAI